MTDKVRKALEAAFKLLGAIEQNPKRRYSVVEERALIMDALGELEVPEVMPAAVAVPDERAAFEKALTTHPMNRLQRDSNGEYSQAKVQWMWEAWEIRAALAATPAAAPAQTIERQRMTAGRASFFVERFLREEKLLGPNEQAALHFVIDMLEAAEAAPQAQADARDALTEVVGCFDAAVVEGLDDALVNNTDARLADLVQRRLMHAYYAAIAAAKDTK